MIIEATATEFEALIRGVAPGELRLVSDSALAPPEVLQMLCNLADKIRPQFAPSAWMMVENGEVVGLCSLVRLPVTDDVHIGYGVAPSRQGTGVATRAVRELVEWARGDARVGRVSAETSVDNVASQRVLERNGFIRTGERVDAEDGPLICWQVVTV